MAFFWGTNKLPEDVYEAACQRVADVYEKFDHVAVSFSGGKDSTAVLNVALEVAEKLGKLPLRAIFWDEEAIPFETEDYVRRVAEDPRVELEWLCLPVKHRNACSTREPWWYPWAPEAEDRWVRPLPPEAITELPGFPTEPEKRLTIPEMNGLLFDPRVHGNSAFLVLTEDKVAEARAWVLARLDALEIDPADEPKRHEPVATGSPVGESEDPGPADHAEPLPGLDSGAATQPGEDVAPMPEEPRDLEALVAEAKERRRAKHNG